MPLHPDAIPTSEQLRETLLDRFYYPYKKQIWAAGAVVTFAIVGFLGAREYQKRRLDEQWTRWDAARRATVQDPQAGDSRLVLIERLLTDFPADPVTPWALLELAVAQRSAGQHEEALKTLERLRHDFPGFVLNSDAADKGSAGQTRTLAERLEALTKDERQWSTDTAYVHPEPSKDTLALVETTAGNFWLGFYPEHAPDHVANFIARAKAGEFNGTQIYDVRTGGTPEMPTPMLFEGGSSASRFDAPEEKRRNPGTHDEDEPDATIDPEESRFQIHHLRGVVSAVVMPSGEGARRFMVVAAAKLPRYDGENTPFAMVLLDREGSAATIDRISAAKTYDTDPTTKDDTERFRMRNHPYPPIWIRRVTIWKDEKLVPGHVWDTSRAGTKEAQPEPWEATLPPAPKPSDSAPKPTPKPGETPSEPEKREPTEVAPPKDPAQPDAPK